MLQSLCLDRKARYTHERLCHFIGMMPRCYEEASHNRWIEVLAKDLANIKPNAE